METQPILDIRGLKTHFFTYRGVVRAVDGVDLQVSSQEMVGIVGETGCGKSVTARSILKLIPEPGKIVSGSIELEGRNLLTLPEPEMKAIRGGQIAMIFQNPLTSLNPVFTIGDQLFHIIRVHQTREKSAIRELTLGMLSLVRLPNPNRLLKKYPHELSGGQLQRIMIAMALSCKPRILIADEPTTALDVTIQAQILTLMLQLKAETRTSILLITHDLGIVAETCERTVIMYAGKIVESGVTVDIFQNALHPYTEGLMQSIPGKAKPGEALKTISGSVPDLVGSETGCRFHPRCPQAQQKCRENEPELKSKENGHFVACFAREMD